MPVTVQFDLPYDLLRSIEETPEAFAHAMRVAAAVKWYETGRVSQGKGAELAGLSREAFHRALGDFGVSAFQVTPDELREELQRL
ncbi:MAG: UPF0175 family protein [Bacteroidota bacterium]